MPDNNLVFLPGWGFKAGIFSHPGFYESDYNSDINNACKNYKIDLPIINALEKLDELQKTEDLTSANYLNILDIITDELNGKIPDNSIMVGWSLGGLIAIYLAYKFPKKFKKLITIGATPKFVAADNWHGIPQDISLKFYHDAEISLHNLSKKFQLMVTYPSKDPKIIKHVRDNLLNIEDNSAALMLYLKMLFELDLRTYYKSLKLPMLHIFGENDAILPCAAAKDLLALNNMAAIEIMPNSGHLCALNFLSKLRHFVGS